LGKEEVIGKAKEKEKEHVPKYEDPYNYLNY